VNDGVTMHDDEIQIDEELVSRLVASQYPEAAHLPVKEFRSTGTVNAVYRLGGRLLARLPRVPRWASDLDSELEWLPRIGPRLTLRVPVPIFTGSPSRDFPLRWAVYEWINGSPYSEHTIEDEARAGRDLACFLTELRRMRTADAPRAGRRPLAELDSLTREAISLSGDVIDGNRASARWEEALRAPEFSGEPVWIHTDLLRPNLLAADGRLAAVIDWGGAGIGDPAADVIAAWSVFGASGRWAFRDTLGVDNATWSRARGYALHQAAMIIPYYRTSNPAFVFTAVRTVREITSDTSA
jgi:aminoglycoside phosphotransferase (APT) family kinase protein